MPSKNHEHVLPSPKSPATHFFYLYLANKQKPQMQAPSFPVQYQPVHDVDESCLRQTKPPLEIISKIKPEHTIKTSPRQ